MKLTTTITLAALALFAGTAAMAQTTPAKPAVTAPAVTAPAAVPAKPVVTAPAVTAPVVIVPDATDDAAKKAKSKACSDQADAKKLHGKERKKFREECKKAA